MSEPGGPRTESFKISQTAPNPKPLLLLLNQKKDEKRKEKKEKKNPSFYLAPFAANASVIRGKNRFWLYPKIWKYQSWFLFWVWFWFLGVFFKFDKDFDYRLIDFGTCSRANFDVFSLLLYFEVSWLLMWVEPSSSSNEELQCVLVFGSHTHS